MSEIIAIQGGPASYHDAAALRLAPNADLMYGETFTDVFRALESGDIDGAVVAIANNRIQYLPDTYEYIMGKKSPIQITGETYLQIGHALLGPKGTVLEDVREVHSQAPALAQCSHYLQQVLPHAKIVEESDTARSAEIVAEANDPAKAAIASPRAGQLHGLKAIRLGVQDDPSNITRFLRLEHTDKAQPVPDANKTSIQLSTPNSVGGLRDVLTMFEDAGINLMSLQSLLIPNSAFAAQFFMEFEAGVQEERTKAVLGRLKAGRYTAKVLGSYRSEAIPIIDGSNCGAIHEAALTKAVARRKAGKRVAVAVPKHFVIPNIVSSDMFAAMGMKRGRLGFELAPHPVNMQEMLIVEQRSRI